MCASDVTSLSLVLFSLSPDWHCKADAPLILILFYQKLTFLIFNCVSAETEPHEGKRKVESLWPIFRLHHQRSRYIYDLFYKRKAISRGRVFTLPVELINFYAFPFLFCFSSFPFLSSSTFDTINPVNPAYLLTGFKYIYIEFYLICTANISDDLP